jgi:hypothetical protein
MTWARNSLSSSSTVLNLLSYHLVAKPLGEKGLGPTRDACVPICYGSLCDILQFG